ncbi:MAG: hypothetical protein H7196_02535 [candidate division SR1 bacterium]|nr:hypothetical protein [candidate division SR1 bacterium]
MLDSTFTLYDSYKKQNLPIVANNNKIKIYSCGPTVYSYQHIGNMRAIWLASSFVDLTNILDIETEWVLNVTDVGHLVGDGDDSQNTNSGEDKFEKGAKKDGKSIQELVSFYQKDYENQCSSLNIKLPKGKYYPKATDYINEQMILALKLLEEKKAYLLDDGIYFDSEANQNLDVPFELVKGDREFTGRKIENTTKNPADFALWKFVNDNSLQKWRFNEFDDTASLMLSIVQDLPDSRFLDLPNRWGCPGWHSECVAMICKILSGSFPPNLKASNSVVDIHFGGEDHIDIHHKNEILQSEALNFHLSNLWVHNKFVTIDGKKMAKSIGNVYTIIGSKKDTGFQSIEEQGYDPLSYRLLLQEHHFTSQLDFTWGKLKQSQNRLHNLRKETAKIVSFWNSMIIEPKPDLTSTKKQNDILSQPLKDNFNVPRFLEKYEELVNETSNAIINTNTVNANNITTLKYWEKAFLKLDLFPIIPKKITLLANQRILAKNEKNYQKSDEIRDQILAFGYQIDDYPWGYGIWMK